MSQLTRKQSPPLSVSVLVAKPIGFYCPIERVMPSSRWSAMLGIACCVTCMLMHTPPPPLSDCTHQQTPLPHLFLSPCREPTTNLKLYTTVGVFKRMNEMNVILGTILSACFWEWLTRCVAINLETAQNWYIAKKLFTLAWGGHCDITLETTEKCRYI